MERKPEIFVQDAESGQDRRPVLERPVFHSRRADQVGEVGDGVVPRGPVSALDGRPQLQHLRGQVGEPALLDARQALEVLLFLVREGRLVEGEEDHPGEQGDVGRRHFLSGDHNAAVHGRGLPSLVVVQVDAGETADPARFGAV